MFDRIVRFVLLTLSAVMGGYLGACAGFFLVYSFSKANINVAENIARNGGDMDAADVGYLGLLVGIPAGGVLGCGLGLWLAILIANHRQRSV